MRLNQNQFAKRLGIDRAHVTRLKQWGMLVFADDGLIDVAATESLMAGNQDPGRDPVRQYHADQRVAKQEQGDAPTAAKDKNNGKPPSGNAADNKQGAPLDGTKYTPQQRSEMSWAVKMAQWQIDLREAQRQEKQAEGALVELDEVRLAVAEAATIVRGRLDLLPKRIAAELGLGQDGKAAVERLVQEAMDAVRGDMAQMIEPG